MVPMPNFELLYAAPVPVGHRVEITTYQEEVEGLFSKQRASYTHVRDLTTGIVYGPHELFWDGIGIRFGERLAMLDAPREDLQIAKKLVGEVTSCRLVTVQLNDSCQIQTSLVLED